jgi:hypothetical protein
MFQAGETAKRTAQQAGHLNAAAAPVSKAARVGAGSDLPRSTLANPPMKTGALQGDTPGTTGMPTVANTAVPLNQAERKKDILSWQGAIVANEVCYQPSCCCLLRIVGVKGVLNRVLCMTNNLRM